MLRCARSRVLLCCNKACASRGLCCPKPFPCVRRRQTRQALRLPARFGLRCPGTGEMRGAAGDARPEQELLAGLQEGSSPPLCAHDAPAH